MKTENGQFDKRRGTALLLVVVVTVLLAVVGVMFLMVSRASELETSAVIQSKDLDAAVETVVARINDVLVEDLFGQNFTIVDADSTNLDADEPFDYMTHHPGFNNGLGFDGASGTADDPIDPGANAVMNPLTAIATNDDVWLPGTLDDYWLASLLPVWRDTGPDLATGTAANMQDDTYVWPHITDLWGTIQGRSDSLYYHRYINTDHIYYPQTTPLIWIDPDYTTNATHAWHGWFPANWGRWEVSAENVRATTIQPDDRTYVIAVDPVTGAYPDPWASATVVSLFGARADADGDGVADSRWVQIPALTTSRGEPVYAAIRIIDNCAMLNLNGASLFYQEPYTTGTPFFPDDAGNAVSPFEKPWFENEDEYVNNFVPDYNGTGFSLAKEHLYHKNHGTGSGRFLTEMNYLPFLRGADLNGGFFGAGNGDTWYDFMFVKNMYDATNTLPYPSSECDLMFRQIDTVADGLQFFDISNELELRNRHLLTSLTEARIEQADALNFTLDSGGGVYAALRIPRNQANFNAWKIRVNDDNFDNWSGAIAGDEFKTDRRQYCTVYSYDRMFRQGNYPQLSTDILTYATANFAGAGFANAATYYQYLLNQWGAFFIPASTVTTDISVPFLNTTSGRWEFNRNNTETRRRILHLLFAFREHFLNQAPTPTVQAAAKSAAQVVANLIDFSDDDSQNTQAAGETEGPFYDDGTTGTIDYGAQANADCTFITEAIIEDMLEEVSTAYGFTIPAGTISFGLDASDVIFGYEKQPFISEIYAEWNGSLGSVDTALQGFAIELVNPYSNDIYIDGWKLRVGDGSRVDHDIPGTGATWYVSKYDTTAGTHGRFVIESNASVFSEPGGILAYPAVADLEELDTAWNNNEDLQIQLLRPAPANSGVSYILVDVISTQEVRSIMGYSDPSGNAGDNALKRDDQDWKFAYAEYEVQRDFDSNYTDTLGQDNGINLSLNGFQIGVADDELPLARWHDLEILGLYGNEDENSTNANPAITTRLASAPTTLHFDLSAGSSDLLDYISTVNRPDSGSLPGRININTAPVQVIAAAIPPSLADPNAADPAEVITMSALQLAQKIVDYRETNSPFDKVSDLLNIPEFKQYVGSQTWGVPDADNVGMQSITEDIEEEHWVFSCLANKFTVRSDVFTAYILVRLGEDGPQRRMIAIFDRSQVWNNTDRPKLLALHPVPDPR